MSALISYYHNTSLHGYVTGSHSRCLMDFPDRVGANEHDLIPRTVKTHQAQSQQRTTLRKSTWVGRSDSMPMERMRLSKVY